MPMPCVYRFGFLLGREVLVESLGFLPAGSCGGLCPWPGLAGRQGLPGLHAPAVTQPGQNGRQRRHGALGAGLQEGGASRA